MGWLQTDNRRTWLFHILVATVAVLMLISFSLPWWATTGTLAEEGQFIIKIYGYGLRHNMIEMRQYIIENETPLYQTVIAWVYVTASTALALFSTWLKNKKGYFLLGSIGLAYAVYAAVAMFVVIGKRIEDYSIALQGITSINEYRQVGLSFISTIEPGFYLALAAGGLCIVIALIRDIISRKFEVKNPNRPVER